MIILLNLSFLIYVITVNENYTKKFCFLRTYIIASILHFSLENIKYIYYTLQKISHEPFFKTMFHNSIVALSSTSQPTLGGGHLKIYVSIFLDLLLQ